MRTEEQASKVCPLKLVKSEKALNLAESWVNNMSVSTKDESCDVEFEGRPARLGLGAKIAGQSKLGASSDPVEKKLLDKLNAKKRLAANSMEKSNQLKIDGHGDNDDEDDDDDLESRANIFSKKRTILPASLMLPKKKKRKV